MLQRRIPDAVPICVRGVGPFGDKMNWMGRHHESYERLRDFVRDNGDILYGVGFDTGVFLSGARVEERRQVIREDEDWSDIEHCIETPLGPIRSITRRSRHNLYEVMEVEYFIKDEEDYRRFMSIPYVPVRPEVREVLSAKEGEVAESGILSVFMPEAIAYAHELFGSEGLALWSKTQRGLLMELFDMLGKRVLDYVGHLLREGAGQLFSCAGAELAVPPLMSPGDFHDFVTRIDKPVHELVHAHGGYTCIHCHGTLDKVLEEFVDIGVDILEPVEAPPGGNVTLHDAKRRIGDKVILMGNMPYEAIISWTPEQIRQRVKEDCEAAMDGGGYIMMPAASPFEPVLSDRAFEGYKEYVRAGREYGRY